MEAQPQEQPEVAPGQKLINDGIGAGYSPEETQGWKAQQYQDGLKSGYSMEEMKKYFGDDKEPDSKPMQDHFAKAIEEAKPKDAEGKPKPATEAKSWLESFEAGLQSSASGLDLRKAPPDITPNQHADMAMRIMQQAGQLTGDLPFMIVGGAAGTVAGAATLNPVGMAMGAGYGAMAFPEAVRTWLMDGYQKGEIKDASDFASRLVHASWEAHKQGFIGALTAGVGGAIKPVMGLAPALAAEIGTMTMAGAAVQGRTPEPHEFLDASIMVGGLHAASGGFASSMPKKFAEIYKNTGERPVQIAEAMNGDVVLNQEMHSENPDLPEQAAPKPEEPTSGVHKLYQGVRATNIDGKDGVSPYWTTNLEKARGYANAEGSGGVIKVTSSDHLPEHTFTDDDGQPISADDHFKIHEDIGIASSEADKVKVLETLNAEKPAPTIEDLHKKFNAYIGETPGEKEKLSFVDRVKEGFDQKYADHMDFTTAMQHAMDEVNAHPGAEDNPVILTRLHADYMKFLQHFIEKGTLDAGNNPNGESLKDIQTRYEKEFPDDPNREGWKAYGIAARALEKADQRTSSGKLKEISVAGQKIDLDEARQIVDDGKEKFQKYVDARTEYGNKVLDYGASKGLWSDKQVKAMKDANLSYMDLNRLTEPDEMTGKTKGSGKAVNELIGEGGLFQDPMLSWLKNTDRILRLAKENEIKSALVKQVAVTDADGNPHPDAWLKKVDTDLKPIQVDAKELDAGLRKQGIELNDSGLEGMTIFRPAEKRLGPNRMEILVDGKREVYEGPSELIDSVNRLKGNPVATDVFSQVLKGFAAVERVSTVGTPWFAAKHAWRQQQTASVFSQYGYAPVDWVKNAWDINQKPEVKALWNQFFVDGGGVSSLKAFDSTYVDSQIYKLDKEIPFMAKQWNRVEKAVQLSHVMIVNHDNLIRFSEYKGALEAGKSRTESAFAAREVLPDFQKAGLQNAFIFQQTAFLKVHLQGLDRMVQAGKEDVGSLKELNAPNNAIRALGFITLPHILLAAANWGDKDIDQLEPFQRYGYYNLPITRWEKTTIAQASALKDTRPDLIRQNANGDYEYNNKIMFRVQNPFSLGIAFGGVADAALKSIQDKNPQAMKDWATQVAMSTVATPIPNFATAPYAQAINYESFTGRPVVSLAKEKLLPEMQYDQYTSETAKTLGKLIQAVPFVGDLANQIGPAGRKITSPMVLDMYIRETTGTMGQLAVSAIDKALMKSGVSQVKNEPESTLADYPIIREFVWRHPTMRAEDITTFLNAYEEADRVKNSVRAKDKEGSFNLDAGMQAMAMREQYSDVLLQRLAGPHQAIKNMNQMIQGLRLLPDMDPTEKRQLTDQYYYRMVQLAQDGQKQIDQLRKGMKNQSQGVNP